MYWALDTGYCVPGTVYSALAAGIPEDRAPIVRANPDEYTMATYNDPQLTEHLAAIFEKALGRDNVLKMPPLMSSEDFGYFGYEDHRIPVCQFALGAVDPVKFQESKKTGTRLPGLHSSLWAPLPEPTIRTGVKSMTTAVLELMK